MMVREGDAGFAFWEALPFWVLEGSGQLRYESDLGNEVQIGNLEKSFS